MSCTSVECDPEVSIIIEPEARVAICMVLI
jgi:hypothetical protein